MKIADVEGIGPAYAAKLEKAGVKTTDELLARLAERHGFEVVNLHRVRTKRTGSSIVNSSVRVGGASQKAELYETAVELRVTD